MKRLYKLVITLFFLFTPFYFVNAQSISTSDILGNPKDEQISELDQKEEEREQDFLNQLLLDIPILTDNPSHIITFVDPSEQKSGVQLEIDGKSFQDIKSPYTLPALSIGKHELRFKFVDKYGSTQILEKEIIIVPRPPIINSPTFDDTSLIVSGTGLSNSEINLILSSSKKIFTLKDEIDQDGKWEIKVEKSELNEGIFTFTAYTRRNGYASDLAEPVTFEIGSSENIMMNGNSKEIYFKFKDLKLNNVLNHTDLIILVIASFLLGSVLSSIILSLIKNKSEDKKIKVLEKKITENGSTNKDITLKERLSKAPEKKEDIKKEEKEKKEEKKEERIVAKIDFLKDFKMFDPDDEKGKEKNNIKVTVTSKD